MRITFRCESKSTFYFYHSVCERRPLSSRRISGDPAKRKNRLLYFIHGDEILIRIGKQNSGPSAGHRYKRLARIQVWERESARFQREARHEGPERELHVIEGAAHLRGDLKCHSTGQPTEAAAVWRTIDRTAPPPPRLPIKSPRGSHALRKTRGPREIR